MQTLLLLSRAQPEGGPPPGAVRASSSSLDGVDRALLRFASGTTMASIMALPMLPLLESLLYITCPSLNVATEPAAYFQALDASIVRGLIDFLLAGSEDLLPRGPPLSPLVVWPWSISFVELDPPSSPCVARLP